jgi:ubiquinone/menaquinone biosynthesis C-methylase UbiE
MSVSFINYIYNTYIQMPITNTLRTAKRSFNIFSKTTWLHKILYFLAFLICMSLMLNYGRQQVEGFEPPKTNEFKTSNEVPEIYDDFYATIYDDLVFNKNKNDYEIGKWITHTNPSEQSVVLDIGSGTGHHVSSLKAHGYNAIGIDVSPSMVKKAKEMYPDLRFQVADALNSTIFPEEAFTHITAFYFTLYYIKDKRTFFDNCMRWLTPGGFLAVHIVNRDKFDPILPAGNPFNIVSPQKYAKKRITSTIVKFDEFEYKSNFLLKERVGSDEPSAIMKETFKNNKSGNVRQNEHNLYMSTQAEILDIAKSSGFIIDSKIDLINCQYDSQYIYVLQKPT